MLHAVMVVLLLQLLLQLLLKSLLLLCLLLFNSCSGGPAILHHILTVNFSLLLVSRHFNFNMEHILLLLSLLFLQEERGCIPSSCRNWCPLSNSSGPPSSFSQDTTRGVSHTSHHISMLG